MVLTTYAKAKTNITLDVISKRSDGYHNLKMIMQTVELADKIIIETGKSTGINVVANLKYLPSGHRNIAYGAAALFFEKTGIINPGLNISIEKNIPVGAGLAGGSTDAAAVLKALNDIFDTGLNVRELMELGLELGADVPYCLLGGSALAEGKGEILTPLKNIPECIVVIAKPPVSISTASAFSALDCKNIKRRPDTDGALKALENGDLRGICVRMYNVFEEAVSRGHSEIAVIKERLIDSGALGACMSGSGPSVFGIFNNETLARNAYDNLKKDYINTFLTKIV